MSIKLQQYNTSGSVHKQLLWDIDCYKLYTHDGFWCWSLSIWGESSGARKFQVQWYDVIGYRLCVCCIRVSSNAAGQGALAIGAVSTASNTGSVAIGINSKSSGTNSIAIGSGSQAQLLAQMQLAQMQSLLVPMLLPVQIILSH